MAPNIDKEADHIRDKARKDLLNLLEGVRKAAASNLCFAVVTDAFQVRGKKNVVLSRDLTGPLGLFVSFTTLKEYGVDKVFELENNNTDLSQRNIIYIVHGEQARTVQAVAGMVFSLACSTGTYKEIAWNTAKLLAISLAP